MTSLNPVLPIGLQIREVIRRHERLSRAQAKDRVIELLDLVGIANERQRYDEYPHHFSGGMRQRVMIAMAVACNPRLLIADEPTTALDVTIQAQVMDLLDTLRRRLSMAMLLITHDLGAVAQWADRVAVMYAGRIVEEAEVGAFFTGPRHPYSQGLLGASVGEESDWHLHQPPPDGDRWLRRLGRRRARLFVRPALSAGDRALSRCPSGIAQSHERLVGRLYPCGGLGPPMALLAVQDLRTTYVTQGRAVNSVGLVGESGCGKSTLGGTIVRLLRPSAGSITLDGTSIGGSAGP